MEFIDSRFSVGVDSVFNAEMAVAVMPTTLTILLAFAVGFQAAERVAVWYDPGTVLLPCKNDLTGLAGVKERERFDGLLDLKTVRDDLIERHGVVA